MKTLRYSLGAIGVVLLLAMALSAPQANARPDGYRHGYGHGHHHGWHGPRYRGYWGPAISLGFVTSTLPFGFLSLSVGGNPYYYHGGYFYRPAPVGYVVVSAPLGASVVSLPTSAVRVEIGGRIYYQYVDAYYEWHPASRAYVVVPPPAGVPVAAAAPMAPPAPVAPGSPSGYAPGQVVETLPPGYTAEIVNGVQYYRYGADYFLPTQQDGREVYVVVRI